MTILTLNQAVKACGYAKQTITKALERTDGNGLSAKKNDKGEYEIDLAELLRVFPPKRKKGAKNVPDFYAENVNRINSMERELKATNQLLEQVTGERDRLLLRLEGPDSEKAKAARLEEERERLLRAEMEARAEAKRLREEADKVRAEAVAAKQAAAKARAEAERLKSRSLWQRLINR